MRPPSASTLQALLNAAPCGVMLREQGQLKWVNRTLLEMIGADNDELIRAASAFNSSERFAALLGTEDTVAIPDHDAMMRWLKRKRADAPGSSTLQLEYFLDITREMKLVAAAEALEVRDPDTGVLNQRGILAALDKQVVRTRRYGNPLAIVRLECQSAKGCAQSGPAFCSLVQELRAQLRWVDEVGRLDRSSVLLILPETDEATAERLLDKLQRERIAPLQRDGEWTTASAFTGWRKGDDQRRLLSRVGWPAAPGAP